MHGWPSATKHRLFNYQREMEMARCWYLQYRPRSPSLSERGIDVSTRVSVAPRRGNPSPRERVVRATLHPRYISQTGWPHSRQCHKSRQFSSRSFVETRAERVFILASHWESLFIRALLSFKCTSCIVLAYVNLWILKRERQINIFLLSIN